MKTIIWDPGMIPFSALSATIDSLVQNENKIYFITEQRRRAEWQAVVPKCHLNIYQELEVVSLHGGAEGESTNFLDIYKKIIDDHRTLLIAERVSNNNSWGSSFSNIQNIEIAVFNSLAFLNDIKPDFLLFQATPHALNSWILGKVAESLGIKVYMIQTSPLPWRFWLIEGIDRQIHMFPKDRRENEDCPILNRFIEKNSASYTDAIPSYEKRRIDSRGGKYWSWETELIDCAKHPSLLKSLFKKKKLYDVYNSLTVKSSLVDTKHIVFFMHYQPERTSLPEGKWFSHQWLIIRTLAVTLPNGWRLIVKDHPSIFTGRFNWRYRNPQFYRDVISLPNVDLVSIEEDTFDMIDRAEAIVTITGTVGIQSLIRGTPVFVFGYSSYRDAYGAFEIQSINDLHLAFLSIISMEKEDVARETRQYLKRVMGITVPAPALNNTRDEADVYGRDTRVHGHLELLRVFFENM